MPNENANIGNFSPFHWPVFHNIPMLSTPTDPGLSVSAYAVGTNVLQAEFGVAY